MHKTVKRRLLWLAMATTAVLLAVAAAYEYYPRGLRGPETVAREFIETLLRAPGDLAALRAAGHLEEDDDPLAPLEGMPTRIALDYLHARAREGAAYDIGVAGRSRAEAQRYSAVLEVSERGEPDTPPRRFAVSLQQRESGDWRVRAVSVLE